ncbi:MBL fold metallo-hydrolase [Weissella muntiaci]|nr:MBL fold metallo-hydrolase [Weissella muntiaci]
MLKFEFHPVGQGLFYSGSISNDMDSAFKFVYDIGSIRKDRLDIEIEKYAEPLKNIHYVFLSHIDYDHVSGLIKLKSELADKGGRIENIVMPYARELDDLYIYLNKIFGESNIVLVTKNQDDDQETVEIFEEAQVTKIDAATLSEEVSKKATWEFHFYYVKGKYKEKFRTKRWPFDKFFEDPQNWNNDSIKLLRLYFHTWFKNNAAATNDSSLIMLHRPSNSVDQKETLLTGDSNWKKAANLEEYKKWIMNIKHVNRVDVFQLPHHGAYYNNPTYSNVLSFAKNVVVTYGTYNKFHHPDQEVEDYWEDHSDRLHEVTEKADTRYEYDI